MPTSRSLKFATCGLLSLSFLAVNGTWAKDNKPSLPPYILHAHTVAVVIDPNAGVSLTDPHANQTAQHDVETALLKWGRFTTLIGAQQADLVIVLRKGHGKLVDETIQDPRQNSRPDSVNTADNGINIGAQHGTPPPLAGGAGAGGDQPDIRSGHSQVEVGRGDDVFEVYEGNVEDPLGNAPGWKWVRKDALHPHDVPAVEAFRKAIADAEKQAAKTQASHP